MGRAICARHGERYIQLTCAHIYVVAIKDEELPTICLCPVEDEGEELFQVALCPYCHFRVGWEQRIILTEEPDPTQDGGYLTTQGLSVPGLHPVCEGCFQGKHPR